MPHLFTLITTEQVSQIILAITPALALFFLFSLLKRGFQFSAETRDHLWLQFDKIFVGLLLLFAFWLLCHNLKFYKENDSVINQTWGVVTYFLGLLSGLINGNGKQRAADRNNNETVKATTTVTSITTPEPPSVPTP